VCARQEAECAAICASMSRRTLATAAGAASRARQPLRRVRAGRAYVPRAWPSATVFAWMTRPIPTIAVRAETFARRERQASKARVHPGCAAPLARSPARAPARVPTWTIRTAAVAALFVPRSLCASCPRATVAMRGFATASASLSWRTRTTAADATKYVSPARSVLQPSAFATDRCAEAPVSIHTLTSTTATGAGLSAPPEICARTGNAPARSICAPVSASIKRRML
jgi:hypothetical protein